MIKVFEENKQTTDLVKLSAWLHIKSAIFNRGKMKGSSKTNLVIWNTRECANGVRNPTPFRITRFFFIKVKYHKANYIIMLLAKKINLMIY